MLIFLIGFMGAGKSYIARNLAPILQYDYIDMDKHFELLENKSITEIFNTHGEDYFRKLEHNFLNELSSNQNLIVSTGGGAPCFYNNMEIMNKKGLTIYLNRSKKIVIGRLIKGKDKRPLLKELSPTALEEFYDERLKQREKYYLKAKLKAEDKDVHQIVSLIQAYTTAHS